MLYSFLAATLASRADPTLLGLWFCDEPDSSISFFRDRRQHSLLPAFFVLEKINCTAIDEKDTSFLKTL